MTDPTHDLTSPPAEPLPLFKSWFQQAVDCEQIRYAHAVCLSTVDPNGLPEGRTVLVKEWDVRGFVFFTDAESPKARSLEHLPAAALTFYWGPLERQVRIQGLVEKASDAASDRCFEFRPRGSRITAWASRQSQPLSSRVDLERRVEQHTVEFEGREAVPRPARWQAYRVRPRAIEFWQARAHRLHDRLLYTRAEEDRDREEDGDWTAVWLDP